MQFQYNNTTINYKKEGEGQPVVLLHGFGEDSTIWNHQFNFLKQHCLVIVPDLPGSGRSQMLKIKEDNIVMEDYATAVHALLQHENIETCILLGHSMGGYITLAFAEKYPERLAGWGLVHSTAFADSLEKKNTRNKGIELIRKYGGYAFLKNSIPNLFCEIYKKAHGNKVAAFIKKSKDFTPEALIHYSKAMINRPDRTEILSNSAVPVLFIAGTEDVAAPIQDVLQQVHLPKVVFIYILNGVGHIRMCEQTDTLNHHLLQFIIVLSWLR